MASRGPVTEKLPTGGFRLNIATDPERKKFMRAILPDFLRVVDPRQSGFLDVLYANDVITDSDNSSLSGKDVMTRKDQARKLFILLNKVSVDVFLTKVAPELCAKFPHIIPERFKAMEDSASEEAPDGTGCESVTCVRHSIQQRIRPATLADMLYHEELCDLEEYTVIIDGARKKEDVWVKIFQIFTNRSQSEQQQLENIVRQLQERYYIHMPKNIGQLVCDGLPCTCTHEQKPPQQPCLTFVGKVGSWLRDKEKSPERLPETATFRRRASSDSLESLDLELMEFLETMPPPSSENTVPLLSTINSRPPSSAMSNRGSSNSIDIESASVSSGTLGSGFYI